MIGGTYYDKKGNSKKESTEFLGHVKGLMVYFFSVVLVFALFHPHIFLDLEKYVAFYMREKYDWLDRTQVSLFQIVSMWVERSIFAIGLPTFVLALIGMFLPEKGRLCYKGPIIIFIFLYYAFFRSAFNARYVISITPILCIFAAKVCFIFLSYNNKKLKHIMFIIVGVVLGYSLYISSCGISMRFNDSRSLAARYIDEAVKEGTSIGLGYVSEEYNWRHFPWWYPRVDYSRYKEVDFLDEPEFLIISSYAFAQIQDTLQSRKFSSGYVLQEKYRKEWYRYSPPSPRILEFYDVLLNKGNSRYVLVKAFKRKVNVPIEFPPPEIRIFRKR